FWLKTPEDPWPYLFIATQLVDQVGSRKAYQAVGGSLQHLPGLCISSTDIKLIGPAKPIAEAVRKLQQEAGEEPAIHLRGGHLANLAGDEVYIFPLPTHQKRSQFVLGKVKLKRPVEQTAGMDQVLAPLSPQESQALEQIVASGISPTQAD